MSNKLILLSIASLTFCCLALAYEPSPLQDFCVADPSSSGIVSYISTHCKTKWSSMQEPTASLSRRFLLQWAPPQG
ncbi:hypothetical protein Tco_1567627, partial [Tanacetum coccineum]